MNLKEEIDFLNEIKYFDMPLEFRIWIAKKASRLIVPKLLEVEDTEEVSPLSGSLRRNCLFSPDI